MKRHHENWCLFFLSMTSYWDVLHFRCHHTENVDRLRVLLAVSHPLLRQAMVEVLEKIDQFRTVGTVANGWDVMRISAQLKPDIILVDFRLPGLSGFEITRLITRELPKTLVIILLDEENEEYVKAVEQSGAWAHLAKSQLAQELPSLLDKLGQAK